MNLARLARPVSRALSTGALCVIAASATWAQGTITGRVTAAGTGEPLASARVIVIGSNSSGTTGQDGKYTIHHVGLGAAEVQVMRVGYEAQKKSVTVESGSSATADFQLSTIVVKLADVLTTATGEQRRIELGYSVSTLGDVATRMEQSPTTITIGDLLVQKSPGVNVLGQGMIGTASSIRVRGLSSISLTNEPIILIDGVRVGSANLTPGNGVGGTLTSLLNSFSPEEIEDVEVIKGPSASTLYGTDAANGVVVITTKRGHVGDSKWTWITEQGVVQDRNDYPASYAIWGHSPGATTPSRCLLATMGAATCVQDSVTSLNILSNSALTPIATSRRQQYGVQANGGSEAVRFFINGNIENALGPIQMPDFAQHRLDSLKTVVRGEWHDPEAFQRENFRVNINASLTPNFDLGLTTGFVKSDQRFPQSDASPVGIYAAARESPGFAHAGLGYSGLGTLGEDLHGYNLWIPSEIFQDLSTEGLQRQTMTASGNWRPYSWMQNDATVGLDFATFTDAHMCRLNECPAFSALRSGESTSRTTNSRVLGGKIVSASTWAARPNLNLKTTVGTDYTNVEGDASNATGFNLPPGAQNVGQAAQRTGASNLSETAAKTLGVYVQEQAAFHDRLFLTLGMRSDENAAFGSSLNWVNYPKASLSWILSDESFFPHFSWVDQFRFRSAFGGSGLQPGLTAARTTYASVTSSINGLDSLGLRGNQVGNPSIKPERSTEFETGFDARIFKSRVNIEATYYSKHTRDALLNVPIAASSASPALSIPVNLGRVSSSGFEGAVTTQLVDRRVFGWDVTVGASHNSNKILSLGPNGPIINGNIRQALGYPVDGLWYRKYTYSDANGDGRIQPSEVAVDTAFSFVGYAAPRDIISLQNGFDLFSRKLHVSLLVDYKGGQSVFDAGNAFLCQQYQSCPDESNPSASLASQARNVANRYGSVVNGNTYTTGYGYLSNGRFWRIRELSATLLIPEQATRRFLRANSASLNFGARNLHTWSNYSGVDPESNFGAGDYQVDGLTAGPPTYFTLRLNLHY